MANVTLTLDAPDFPEIMAEITTAVKNPARLPLHLRDEVTAFASGMDVRGGFDAWFDLSQSGGRVELQPSPRLLALLANLRGHRERLGA